MNECIINWDHTPYLMEMEVAVEGDDFREPSGPCPCDSVSTHG